MFNGGYNRWLGGGEGYANTRNFFHALETAEILVKTYESWNSSHSLFFAIITRYLANIIRIALITKRLLSLCSVKYKRYPLSGFFLRDKTAGA